MGWNSLGSVFPFLPLSVLIVPEYKLFAKVRFKDGREEEGEKEGETYLQ